MRSRALHDKVAPKRHVPLTSSRSFLRLALTRLSREAAEMPHARAPPHACSGAGLAAGYGPGKREPPEPTARGTRDKGPPCCRCHGQEGHRAPPAGPSQDRGRLGGPTGTIRFPHLPWRGYCGRNFSQAPRGCHLPRSFGCVIPAPPATTSHVSKTRWCFCILEPIINCLLIQLLNGEQK